MKFISLSLIVGFSILSLVACNKGDSGGNSPAPAEQTGTPTPTGTAPAANPAPAPAPEVASNKNKSKEELENEEAQKRKEKFAKLDQQLVQVNMKDEEKDLIEVLSFSKLLEEGYEHLDEIDERAVFIGRLKADTTAIFVVDGETIDPLLAPRRETRIFALNGKDISLKAAFLRAEAFGSVEGANVPMLSKRISTPDIIDVIEVDGIRMEDIEEDENGNLVILNGETELTEAQKQRILEAIARRNNSEVIQPRYKCPVPMDNSTDCHSDDNVKPVAHAEKLIHGKDYFYWHEMSTLDVDRQLEVSCKRYGFEIIEQIMTRQLNNSFANEQMEKSGLIAMKCMARTYPFETAKSIARVLDGRKSIDEYLREINSPVLAVAAGQLAMLKKKNSDLTEDLLDDLKIDQHNLRKDVAIAINMAQDDDIVLSLVKHLSKYKAESDEKYIYRPAAMGLIRLNDNKSRLKTAMRSLMKRNKREKTDRKKMQTLRRSIKSIAFINGEKICDEIELNKTQDKALEEAIKDFIKKDLNSTTKSVTVDRNKVKSLQAEVVTIDNKDYHILEKVVGKDQSSPYHRTCIVE